MSKSINPSYKKHSRLDFDVNHCLQHIKSDKQILSYLISKTESSLKADKEFINEILKAYEYELSNRIIAISGAPGVGKSTFINSFASYLSSKHKKVAILPVDPTSQISKGSILGDKTRMDKLIGEEMVFIKPTSSSLALGGIAPSSYQSIMLCEMAGYDYILLETVGVGQSEFLAHNFSDLFLLLMQPAAGDELQGIKRGIMEMADLLLINKADGDLKNQAEKTQKNYKQAISYYSHKDSGWIVKTQLYSSISDEYTTELMQLVDKYFEHMKADKRLKKKRSDQRIRYFETALKDVILQHFTKDTLIKETVSNLLSKVSKQEIHPVAALNKLEESLS